MDSTGQLGKILIVAGVLIAAIGAVVLLGGRVGLGRLPGDIVYRKGSFTFYLPWVTCLLLSLVLTLVLSLFRR
jgi:Protein of unknown function (DUF2905)